MDKLNNILEPTFDALVTMILSEADAIKAVNIEVYDVSKRSSIVDYFIICSGTSNVHVESIAKRICDRLKETKESFSVDGTKGSRWIVIDAGNVITHVMGIAEREKYKLEEIWQSRSTVIYHQ